MTEEKKSEELEQKVMQIEEEVGWVKREKLIEGRIYWHKDGFYRPYPEGLYYDKRTGHYRIGRRV